MKVRLYEKQVNAILDFFEDHETMTRKDLKRILIKVVNEEVEEVMKGHEDSILIKEP